MILTKEEDTNKNKVNHCVLIKANSSLDLKTLNCQKKKKRNNVCCWGNEVVYGFS